MKKVLENCHNLIQSLAKGEKKKINLILSKSNTNNTELLLYQTLNKMSVFDKKKLTVQLKKKGVKNFDVLVHRLYRKILSSLFDGAQKRDKELELVASLNHVYTLKNRDMHDSALLLLKSIEKDAKDAHLGAILYQATHLKKRILIELENSFDLVKICLEDEQNLLDYLSTLCELNQTRIDSTKILFRREPDSEKKSIVLRKKIEKIVTLFPEDLLIRDNLLEVILTEQFILSEEKKHEEDLIAYELCKQKIIASIEERKLIYDENNLFRATHQRKYMSVLINQLIFHATYQHFPKINSIILELGELINHNFFFKKNKNYILNFIDLQLLSLFLLTGVIDSSVQKYADNTDVDFTTLPPRRQFEYFKFRALYHWVKGRHEKALECLYYINEIKSELLSPNHLIEIKLYEGLIQLELENYRLLVHIHRSATYYLKQGNKTAMESQGIFEIIKFIGLVGKTSPLNRKELLQLIVDFTKKHSNYNTWSVAEVFSFDVWIKSLLREQKMEDILRQQNC